MPRCPNCSYILALLEKRRLYKCASCGKLFFQKGIEFKEFREQNKKQKELDKQELERQLKLRRKLLKAPNKKPDPSIKQKRLQEYREAYYESHKAQILAYKQIWRKNAKERNNTTRKRYRVLNREQVMAWSRINYWRQAQKGMVLRQFFSRDNDEGSKNHCPLLHFRNY